MPKSDRSGDLQYAALPYRFDRKAGLMILLLTSRGRGRWIIPKGWPMKGRKPHRVAEIEAYQEAGILGKAAATPLGTFRYDKILPSGEAQPLAVEVFPMRVSRELKKWPEVAERSRIWFPLPVAISMISDPGLVPILQGLSGPRTGLGLPKGARSKSSKAP